MRFFKQLPLFQDESSIVRYWEAFARFVNEIVLTIYYFFVDIYPWGWVFLLFGLWMAFMLFWAREFPRALRYLYYFLFFLYLASLPYMLLYFA